MTDPRIEPAHAATSIEGRIAEAQILASRGVISPLYRILLNSPTVASGWEHLLTAIRQRTSLQASLRELVILRVAVLNHADYEFDAHAPLGKLAGLSDAKIDAVRGSDFAPFGTSEQVALAYVDAMTLDVAVPPTVFAKVKAAFDPQSLVELTATIAAYNMVSRFLVALDVH